MDANDAIQRGNEGMDIGEWTGAPESVERAPLPGHEHTAGVDWEPLPKAFPWLTENRSFAIAGALAVVGIYMGLMS